MRRRKASNTAAALGAPVMDLTLGVRKTAAGFGMNISEQGLVTAYTEPAASSPAKAVSVPVGCEITAVRGNTCKGRADIVRELAGTVVGDAVAFSLRREPEPEPESEAVPVPDLISLGGCMEPAPPVAAGDSAAADSKPPTVRVRVVTWNVAEHDLATGALTSADLRSLLQPLSDCPDDARPSGNAPELVAVGLQEIEMSAEAFGANIVERVSETVRDLSESLEADEAASAASKLRRLETARGEAWAHALATAAGELGYREVAVQQMMGVFLAVFVRSDKFSAISEVVPDTVGCGAGLSSGMDGLANGVEKVMGLGSRFGGLIAGARAIGEEMRGLGLPETGNKGACGIRMTIHGQSVVLIAAHLAAGQGAVGRRESDWRHVEKSLLFEAPSAAAKERPEVPASRVADIAVFFGDLNYRLDLPAEETALAVQTALGQGQFVAASLLAADQMLVARSGDDAACSGWREEPIVFPPTYKYAVGTDQYDVAPPKARAPSYTDRILFREGSSSGAEGPGDRIAAIDYAARNESAAFQVSDHRPVTLLLEVTLPTEAEQVLADLRILGSYLAAAAAPPARVLGLGLKCPPSPGEVASRDSAREAEAVVYYTAEVISESGPGDGADLGHSRQGPVSAKEVLAMLAEKVLTIAGGHLIWCPGMVEWRPLEVALESLPQLQAIAEADALGQQASAAAARPEPLE